jgi:hypothetical protein
MNPLDALVAASDRLVAWLQPIATEFERLTGSSVYRLAALSYRLSLFLMAGEITIGAARYIRFVRVLTEYGANPLVFFPRIIMDVYALIICAFAKFFVDRWIAECGRLADKAEAGGMPIGNSMRQHPFNRAQSLFLVLNGTRGALRLFDLPPDLLGCLCRFANALWPILAILAFHFHACQSSPPSRKSRFRSAFA